MFPLQDQISVATRNSLQANFALYASLINKTFESAEKMFNLNMAAARASMAESHEAVRQILAAKDAEEFVSTIAAQAKPAMEQALAYRNHVVSIAGSTRAEYARAAEVQFAAASDKLKELVSEATRKAPAGTEGMTTIVKSALGTAGHGYEQFSRTARQATEALEASMNAAVAEFVKAAGQRLAA